MKIPSKITKAQHTKLTKRNLKDLMCDITDQCGDLTIEANCLQEWDINNPYEKPDEYKTSIAYWHKEVKLAFRIFKSNKKKLDKAYQNYLSKK